MEGEGKLTFLGQNYFYEGSFKKNLKHGFGVEKRMLKPEGSGFIILYEGWFEKGQKVVPIELD